MMKNFGKKLIWNMKKKNQEDFLEIKEKEKEKMLDGEWKVSNNTSASALAGAVAELIKQNKQDRIELNTIGAGALNQAIKAVAIARGFVTPLGIDIVCVPTFTEVIFDEEKQTGIKLILKVERN